MRTSIKLSLTLAATTLALADVTEDMPMSLQWTHNAPYAVNVYTNATLWKTFPLSDILYQGPVTNVAGLNYYYLNFFPAPRHGNYQFTLTCIDEFGHESDFSNAVTQYVSLRPPTGVHVAPFASTNAPRGF